MNLPWSNLGEKLVGEVVIVGQAGYDAARRPQIANFGKIRPRAVARCATARDVAAALAFAGDNGLAVAVRGGGHCFAGRSSTTGLLVDVGEMNRIRMDGDVAVVGGGARLGDVYERLAAAGRTIPAGCGDTVGLAGLVLGGGVGILGRRYGLTSDWLVGADVVVADGRRLGCDNTEHPDLFWLLRGGGAPGVVTELRVATVPAPRMTGFQLVWSGPDAVALVQAWQEWSPDGPDELAASLLVSNSGPAGRPVLASLHGALLGDEDECRDAVSDFLAMTGIAAESAAYHPGSHLDVKRYLAGIDTHRAGALDTAAHHHCASEFFARSLPDEVVADCVDALSAGRADDEIRELDLMPWAGAYGRLPIGASAFAHRDARFLLKYGLMTPGPATARARAWPHESRMRAHPWGTGGAYVNFPDPDLDDPIAAYYGANAERVRRIRARYDPAGIFDRD